MVLNALQTSKKPDKEPDKEPDIFMHQGFVTWRHMEKTRSYMEKKQRKNKKRNSMNLHAYSM